MLFRTLLFACALLAFGALSQCCTGALRQQASLISSAAAAERPTTRQWKPDASNSAANERESVEHAQTHSHIAPDPVEHWAYQPPLDVQPPAVDDVSWPTSPIDAFILDDLEQAGLRPAERADKTTLLRRVTFDLIGLPPSPDEIGAFLADESPDAFERAVDRLLGSPHYGERWARHWLDLVRYSDTNGVVLDPVKPNAYQYRDYVIDALNQDLPYDQFVREQIAGDLQSEPRLSRDGAYVASPIGSGFWWLGEIMHQLSDHRVSDADELENQIDVFGKAFLGVTLACARCHDHKFDPISQEDYYALGGILSSTTNAQVCLDSDSKRREIETLRDRIADLESRLQAIQDANDVDAKWREETVQRARGMANYLAAIREVIQEWNYPQRSNIVEVAKRRRLDSQRLLVWFDAVTNAASPTDPLFYGWHRLTTCAPEAFRRHAKTVQTQWQRTSSHDSPTLRVWQDFEGDDFGDWQASGAAFGSGPLSRAQIDAINVQGRQFASSSNPSDALTGRLVSPSFVVDESTRYLVFWIAGGADAARTCVNLITHSGVRPQGFEWVATGRNSLQFEPVVWNLERFEGREVYIEVVDQSCDPWGRIMVDDFSFSSKPISPPKLPPHRGLLALLTEASSRAELDAGYEALLVRALERRDLPIQEIQLDELLNDPDALFVCWANEADGPLYPRIELVSLLRQEDRSRWAEMYSLQQRLESELPDSTWAFVSRDRAEPRDMPLHQRGDPLNTRDDVPRRVPASLGSTGQHPTGSGRLELAEWVTSANNPLFARVIVNRIWKHHFGTGLVATPDNFGQLGERPSHSELLDYIARRFMESGYSLKAMHRLMLVSSTYTQSAAASPAARTLDPDNRLLQHMPTRRLEAEAVRDTVAHLGGSLGSRLFGPPIDFVHESAPLRRSVYLKVARNDKDELLTAFHCPRPSSTVGERYATRTPKQSLVMLSDPLARLSARAWAERIVTTFDADEQRVARMYLEAMGRAPSTSELQVAQQFIAQQRQRLSEVEPDPVRTVDLELELWSDLAHVLFNLDEFVTIY